MISYRNLMILFKSYLFAPRLPKISGGFELLTLGSSHGRKTLVVIPELHKGNVISAGVGEDISFDIEIINRFDTTNYLMDPTSKAVNHFNDVMSNSGKIGTKKYSENGSQDIDSYNLQNINCKN